MNTKICTRTTGTFVTKQGQRIRHFETVILNPQEREGVELTQREWAKGRGERREIFFSSPSGVSSFHPRTCPRGCYFYSPQSSSVVKLKMRLQQYIHKQAAFNLLNLHWRLGLEADVIKSLYTLKIFHNLGIANFVSLLFIGNRNLWCAIQVYYYYY